MKKTIKTEKGQFLNYKDYPIEVTLSQIEVLGEEHKSTELKKVKNYTILRVSKELVDGQPTIPKNEESKSKFKKLINLCNNDLEVGTEEQLDFLKLHPAALYEQQIKALDSADICVSGGHKYGQSFLVRILKKEQINEAFELLGGLK